MLKKFLFASVFTALIATASAEEYTFEQLMQMNEQQLSQLPFEKTIPLCIKYKQLNMDMFDLNKEERKLFGQVQQRIVWNDPSMIKCGHYNEKTSKDMMKEMSKRLKESN